MYVYRIRKESIMTKKITSKNVEDYFYSMYELVNIYIQMDCDARTREAIEKYIQRVGREFIKAYRKYYYQNRDYIIPKYIEDSLCKKLFCIFSKYAIEIGTIDSFSEENMRKIIQSEKVLIYGAGDVARDVIEFLDKKDIPIYGVAVSRQEGNRKSLLGNKINEIAYYVDEREKCLVIIATTPKFYPEIRKQLNELKFNNCIEVFE